MQHKKQRQKEKKSTFFMASLRSFLIVSVAITTVLTLVLTFVYTRYISNTVDQFTGRLVAQSSYSVTYINEMAQRLANTLYNDNDVVAFLSMDDLDYQYAIRSLRTMDKQVHLAGCIDSMYLYNQKIDCWLSTSDGKLCASSEFFDQEIVKMLQDQAFMTEYDGKPIARSNQSGSTESNVCSYILSRTIDNELKEVLVINVEISALTESIQEIQSFSDDFPINFMVTDASGKIVSHYFSTKDFDSDPEGVSGLLEYINQNNASGHASYTVNHNSYIISYQKMPSSNWSVVGLVERNILYQDMVKTAFLVLIAAFLSLFLFGGLSVVFARKLSNPVQAIASMLQQKESRSKVDSNIVELQYIDSILKTMQEQNREYENFQNNASNSMRQNFLSDLVSKSTTISPEKITETLDTLGLSFVYQEQLCLCIYKIDDYSSFESGNNHKERCAFRFCIVNIITEMLEKEFSMQAFCYGGDKVVVIADTSTYLEYSEFRKKWEEMLRESLQKIQSAIKISLSCAYSSFFKGITSLPVVFENTQELLSQVLKMGHQSIIAPNSMESFEPDDISKLEGLKADLIYQVTSGNLEAAKSAYDRISESFADISCNDILFFLQNTLYMLYLEMQKKWPLISSEVGTDYKQFVLEFEKADTLEVIHAAVIQYLEKLSNRINSLQVITSIQNSNHIVESVIEIISREYRDKDLCTNSIADELELTANYMGHLFRTHTGKSVPKYIMEVRLEQVGELLRTTELSLNDILDQCGLEKTNYFYTCFKKHFGVTLSDYRKDR